MSVDSKSLPRIERVTLLVVSLALVVMMAKPTPMLQSRSETTDHAVFPMRVEQAPPFSLPREVGGGRVEPVTPFGCVRLTSRDGTQTTACNRHLLCQEGAPAVPRSYIEVYRIDGGRSFYVETGSACDSGVTVHGVVR